MKFPLFSFGAAALLLGTASAFCAEPAAVPTELRLVQLVEKFDRNGDHRLDTAERQTALAYLAKQPVPVSPASSGRPAPTAPQGLAVDSVKAGEKIGPSQVALFPDKPFYQPELLRTLFLEFENSSWEKELSAFARTDVIIPAKLTVDGRNYPGTGVHFQNSTATPGTTEGYKRSMDLTFDFTKPGQAISGQRQLTLLDSSTDPTFLRTLLYSHVARQYIHAPLANLVQVVINGENWGVYVSVEPLDAPFIQQNFGATEGAWWSVSPGGSLAYLGDKAEAYQSSYHLRSKDDPAAWTALIELCKILSQTPTSQLESAAASRLDIDSALRFLALENAMINQDGYGSNTGGYGLYLGKDGRFRLIPQNAEASFRFVEVSEFEKRSRGANRVREKQNPEEAKEVSDKNPSGVPAQKGYNPNNFPRQAVTDLAMLLSYSFVNKADSDFDTTVTREEWLAFARSWFLVMDEDFTGKLTRDQFLTKFRGLITPASVADGRTKQTFGKDDAAGIIGQDFFKVLDRDHDSALTSPEVSEAFAQWFTEWSVQKKPVITQPVLQQAFNSLFSQTIFHAEQSYIARREAPTRDDEERGERGGRGNGLGSGLLRLATGGKGGDTRTLVTFSEELDPLAGLDDETKPLRSKLLSVPVLRTRYLEYVQDINENWLSWAKIGPVAKQYHDLIAAEVDRETHKATSYIHFVQQFDQDTIQGPRNGEAAASLKSFIAERHNYLLKDDNVMGRGESP